MPNPTRLPLRLGAALLVLSAACASGGASSPARRTSGSTRMDSTEFRRPEFRTVYDAVRTLHPDWLQARGGATSLSNTTMQTPVVGVFIEGEGRGYGVEKLAEYVGRDVKSIRHISASESLGTYGAQWPWGGIVVTLTR